MSEFEPVEVEAVEIEIVGQTVVIVSFFEQ